jgi:plastocyanin
MKTQGFSLLTFLLLLIISTAAYSQALHVVEVSDFVFTPGNLTIEVGDTVRWMNVMGNHNVVADDNSFTSGPPSTNQWVYDFVFTMEGTNPYYCVLHGGPGGSGMSGVITVELPVSVSGDDPIVTKFELNQNYPNPFNPSTTISYSVSVNSSVSIKLYNSLGQEVSILFENEVDGGEHKFFFNAGDLPSGTYFYTLKASGKNGETFTASKKMILLK